MFKNTCPKVHMKFAFQNRETNDIIIVHSDKTPTNKDYPKSKYKKLYEEAHLKVKSIF